jgi:hypothetical protein
VGGDGGAELKVRGLQPLLKGLRGRQFHDVNTALRDEARWIADQIVPEVVQALTLSNAPQAPGFGRTVKSKRDRIPIVVIGRTNPGLKKFSRRGPRKDGKARQNPKWRRGAMAHGIIYGPRSGGRSSPAPAGASKPGNYGIPRNPSGGAVMRSIRSGRAYRGATDAYLNAYIRVLRRAGFNVSRGRAA